jgi:periplasmic protein TonB
MATLAQGTIRVDSEVNTIPTSEETVAKLQPLASGATPVALEVAVNVTGARPAQSSGQRDLFSEDTSTVLVFENGAVIRLAAAVVTGQLLFITEKKTNSEVVCQVVRKRSFRPTECYVELEFTEPVTKFWGVDVPARADAPEHKEATEMVESSETAEEDVAAAETEVPGKEVENLKHEVDALREQIQALLQAKAEAAKVEAAREEAANRAEAAAAEVSRISVPGAGPAATAPAGNVPAVHSTPEPSTPAGGKVPEPGPGVAAQPSANAPAPPMIRMTLPNATTANQGGAKEGAEIDPLDGLLPKPALDFSGIPHIGTARVSQSIYDIYKPVRAGIGKFPLAAISTLVLLIFLGGAWRMNWVRLPWLGSYSAHKGISQEAHSANSGKPQSGIAHAAALPTAPSVASTAVPVTNTSSATPKTSAGETSPRSLAGGEDVANAPEKALAPAVPKVAKSTASAATVTRAKGKESGTAAALRRKSVPSAPPDATAQAAPPEPAAIDTTLVPPKLLKSVAPVYPPEAMENYITGDVRVDAVVEPDGKIGAMKILTGPAPLRQAAMDALKQYEYAPATQGGKAVEAHVTATVKFWFNP